MASGRVKIRYEDATTPQAQRGRQLMQDAKVLEDLATHIEDTLNLPSDLGVVGKQCDADNDFYLPDANEIQLCYEAREHAEKLAGAAGTYGDVTKLLTLNANQTTSAILTTGSGNATNWVGNVAIVADSRVSASGGGANYGVYGVNGSTSGAGVYGVELEDAAGGVGREAGGP